MNKFFNIGKQKKSLLSITILMLIAGFSLAQTSVTAQASATIAADNVIIREYKYPASIISAFDTVGKYSIFSYLDSNMVSRAYGVYHCTISDFEVSNDSVFFCGTAKDSSAIIGFFNIHDVFFGNDKFYIQKDFDLCGTFKARNLTKLVTYRGRDGKRHIVCVGYAKEMMRGLYHGCIVDLTSDEHGAFSSYNTGLASEEPVTDMLDITRTEDYIVTAGVTNDTDDIIAGGKICLRIFDKENIFNTLSTSGQSFRFNGFPPMPYGSTLPSWYNKDLRAVYLRDDTIATASLIYSSDYPLKYNYLIHLAKFKLGRILHHQPNAMVASAILVQDDNCKHIMRLNDFVYLGRERNFGVLNTGGTNSNPDSALSHFHEIDLSLTTVINSFNGFIADDLYGDAGFNSLCHFNQGSQYLLGGKTKFYNRRYFFQVETSGQQSRCWPQQKTSIKEYPKGQYETKLSDICMIGGIATPQPFKMALINREISIICEQ